jgi:ankyrin repeat protein
MKKLVFVSLILILAVGFVYAGGSNPEDQFFSAVRAGDTDFVEDYLDREVVDVDVQDENGMTALMIAVNQEDLQMVRTLIPYRPDPDITDNDGRTVMDIAKERGNMAIQSALRGAGF